MDHELTSELATRLAQDEVHPYDKNYFRTEAGLAASLANLDGSGIASRRACAAAATRRRGEESAAALLRGREAAAMVAHARCMYNAGRARTETRGLHKRSDHPELDPAQQQRRVVSGLAGVWNGLDPVKPFSSLELAR